MSDTQIRFHDEAWSTAQFDDQSKRLATAIAGLGVTPGDRVALVMRNDPRFLVATRAIGLVGAVPVPLNWHNTAPEIAYLLEDSAAGLVFVHDQLLELVGDPEIPVIKVGSNWDALIQGSQPWDEPPAPPALAMIYTSGTTGRPKGVLRDVPTTEQQGVLQRTLGQTLDLRPGDRTLIPAPLYHSAPNVHASVALAMGLPLTIMDRFDAEQLLALIEAHQITHLQLVPTMFVRLLQLPTEVRERYDVSSLRSVVHAAAPCPTHVKEAMIAWWGPILSEYYGGTETGPVVHSTSEQWLKHPGTVGLPVETAVVRIRREDGSWAEADETGDVYMRLGCWPDFTYLGDPDKRARAEHEGLITCGDIGHLDGEGYLYLTDRQADVVIAGGVNIYPAEVEAALLQVPGIRDCAAFGIPDPVLGEILIAHVEADRDEHGEHWLTEESIIEAVSQHLARFKVPRRIVFDDALPREASGKLLKRRLKAAYAEG